MGIGESLFRDSPSPTLRPQLDLGKSMSNVIWALIAVAAIFIAIRSVVRDNRQRRLRQQIENRSRLRKELDNHNDDDE